jgi:hypothetical protein
LNLAFQDKLVIGEHPGEPLGEIERWLAQLREVELQLLAESPH